MVDVIVEDVGRIVPAHFFGDMIQSIMSTIIINRNPPSCLNDSQNRENCFHYFPNIMPNPTSGILEISAVDITFLIQIGLKMIKRVLRRRIASMKSSLRIIFRAISSFFRANSLQSAEIFGGIPHRMQ